MLKTKLESLLEAGFSELGVQFGNRVYGEQIRLASSVDDVYNDISVEEYREKQALLRSGEDRLLHEVLSVGRLTKNQWHVYRNTVPFFKRAGVVVPFEVSYQAVSLDDCADYEKIADGLISNIALEVVEIESFNPDRVEKQNVPIVNIIMGRNIALSHFPLEDENYLLKCPPNVSDRLKYVLPLNARPYSPEEVCSAVMKFLE